MPIEQGDVKLVKSRVMDDVPEGGGAATGIVIADGVSNEIFDDISETDRAGGRVSERKIFVSVQTEDTDKYLGANVIVAEPPNDPNVSITIFSTGNDFDTRAEATARIEAYLSVGVAYQGFLFGNHIEGMRTVAWFQRTDERPPVGVSMVLTKREGFSDEFVQYVRVTEVASTLRTFTDAQGDFQRYVLSCKISDPLRQDLPGHDVARIDPTKAQLAALTKISDTLVADAGEYCGVTALEVEAAIGDFTVKGESMFSQLVPSAQIETPIADVRTNQINVQVVSSGVPITFRVAPTFNVAQNMSIGGAVTPGSLVMDGTGISGAPRVTDSAGKLYIAGVQVGIIDYANGVLQALQTVYSGQALDVTYTPAGVPLTVTRSDGIMVKQETRSLSYTQTVEPPPVPGSFSVQYMTQNRWYKLQDDGSGALRGASSSYGAGTINGTTGTFSVTLGALPDVGSAIILQWVDPAAARNSQQLVVLNGGKPYLIFNTDGVETDSIAGSKTITPGALILSWTAVYGGAQNVVDDGSGNLSGHATGTVDYARGIIRMSPTNAFTPGAVITMAFSGALSHSTTPALSAGAGNVGSAGVTPGTVWLDVDVMLQVKYLGSPVQDFGVRTVAMRDNGVGGLVMLIDDIAYGLCGAIDYTTGDFTLNDHQVLSLTAFQRLTFWDNFFLRVNTPPIMAVRVI